MSASNLHATGIVLGTRGLLVVGQSGSGKTTLALALIDAWRSQGRFARLVADDQVLLCVSHGRLVARAPRTIAGLVEIVGLGPQLCPHIGGAVIDGVCRLVPAGSAPRFQENEAETIVGCSLPKILLAERSSRAALLAIQGWVDGFERG